jgi:hypothetical protein
MASTDLSSALKAALQAKRQHTSDLLRRQNVVATGVGFKTVEGQLSREPSVIVSVTQKVPKAQLAPQDIVPQVLNSVKTDVQEVGVFRAWQLGPKDRHRPAVPGISCGHLAVTAGTLGCLVRRGGDVFILSNNHILANINRASRGDAILQPARFDNGSMADQIAVLEEWVPLALGTQESSCQAAGAAASVLNAVAEAAGSTSRLVAVREQTVENRVDCAIARPLSPDLVRSEILHIGTPRGVHVATLGMPVQKSGRTTGYTTGQITQVDVTAQVNYEGQTVTFGGQLMASPMSSGGDSGSAVLDMQGYVVGLLFAGSDMATLINPIQAVLSALNVQIVTG